MNDFDQQPGADEHSPAPLNSLRRPAPPKPARSFPWTAVAVGLALLLCLVSSVLLLSRTNRPPAPPAAAPTIDASGVVGSIKSVTDGAQSNTSGQKDPAESVNPVDAIRSAAHGETQIQSQDGARPVPIEEPKKTNGGGDSGGNGGKKETPDDNGDKKTGTDTEQFIRSLPGHKR